MHGKRESFARLVALALLVMAALQQPLHAQTTAAITKITSDGYITSTGLTAGTVYRLEWVGSISDTNRLYWRNLGRFLATNSTMRGEYPLFFRLLQTPAPFITNVTSTAANATYGTDATVDIQVGFSEAVNVTGAPQLELETGTSNAIAPYFLGGGSDTLVFRYVVAAGHTAADLDYTGPSALLLNGGTIRSAEFGVDVAPALPSPGTPGSLSANKNIVLDTVGPVITNVTSPNANSAYGVGSTISVLVMFNKGIFVTGSPQLGLNSGGYANYVTVSGSSTLYMECAVGPGQSSLDLDCSSTNALFSGTIKDALGNSANRALPPPGAARSLSANKNISIETTAPFVLNVTSSTADGTYVTGQVVVVRVNFSEPVQVIGVPRLTLETGANDAVVDYSSGSGTSSLDFNYTVGAGHVSTDLDYADEFSSLSAVGALIRDAVGNNAYLILPPPSDPSSLGGSKNIKINVGP